MHKERNAILRWTEQGRLPPERQMEALRLLRLLPDGAAWRRFMDRLLLWSGATLLAIGVIFFIAFNWNVFGHFARFGLVEALLAASAGAAVVLGPERPAAKAALFTAALLTGALLALFGQTYQTGADTFQLFAAWALMLLPWALAGRQAPLWMLVVILVDVGITFYFGLSFHRFSSWREAPWWWLFVFNASALVAWELGARRFDWLAERWGPRLLALVSGGVITVLAFAGLFDHEDGVLAMPVYLLWSAALYFIYRSQRRDLFMLAGGVLSALVIGTTLLSIALFHSGFDFGALFIIALAVIGASAGAGRWLMNIAREDAREI